MTRERIDARQFLGGLLGLGALAGVAAAQSKQGEEVDALDALRFPRAFVLVRHAEKAAEPAADPPLTEAGAARAEKLAQMFRHSSVTHVFATEFVRTQATVAPLGIAIGRPPTIVSARDGAGLLSALDTLKRGSLAVIAGHSNTVPALVQKLGGGRAKLTMDESEYDRLFLVVQWGPKADAWTMELRF